MGSKDFVGLVLWRVAQGLRIIDQSLASIDSFVSLIARFGWNLDADADWQTIQAQFQNVSSAFSDLTKAAAALEQLGKGASALQTAAAVEKLGEAIAALASTLSKLESLTPDTSWPHPLDLAEFWNTLPEDLLEYVIYQTLRELAPPLFGFLHFAGVLVDQAVSPTGTARQPYERQGVEWRRIIDLVTDPEAAVKQAYQWGSGFDHELLLRALQWLFAAFNLPGGLMAPSSDQLDRYWDATAPARSEILQLREPLYWSAVTTSGGLALLEVDLIAMPIPATGTQTGSPDGIVLYPLVSGSAGASFDVAPGITAEITGGFESQDGIRAEIRSSGTTFSADPTLGTQLTAAAKVTAAPSAPWILLGSADSTRLDLAKLHAGLSATGPVADLEYIIELGFDTATVVIDCGEGDGLIQTVIGSSAQRLDFALIAAWSSKRGFTLSSQGKLQMQIPVNVTLGGIVEVDSLLIAMQAGGSGNKAVLIVAATGALSLGPIEATIKNVGLQATLSPKIGTDTGNLGRVDFGFGFKAPDGAGLALDAAVVTGGGYIECHPDQHEYDGILQLQLETIGITAIGLLNTVMPDGSTGFSLLLILSGQFEDAPIELGFGFELTGVGGLAGINRTMVVDVLRNGVRNGTVRSIMFPDDPVKNGPKIISDLRSIFPPREGHYVFGPMVELAWGVPPLIVAQLGVILELPPPIRIVILGRIKAALPDEDIALIEIHMDTLGVLDFEKKSASVDATLYDSRVVQYALSGDMAFRLNWADGANWALAVGGFNPRFQPPPGFPSLRHVTLSMGVGDNPRLSLDGYVAVTPNSLQFGAQVSVYAAEGGFAIRGALGFDVLFVKNPLSMIADMQGSVELLQGTTTLMTVQVQFTLSGPSPWHGHGSASAHILFLHPNVNIDKQWGDPAQQQLPQTNAATPFLNALKDPASWTASPPPGSELPVSLGGAPAHAGTVLVHPVGQVSVRQKVVPLEVTISCFGSGSVAGPNYFRLAAVTVDGHPAAGVTPVSDEFAMGQFLDLSDDEKLSRPSFEPQTSGVTIGSGAAVAGHRSSVGVQYETFVIDNQGAASRQGIYKLGAGAMAAARRCGAGALSSVLTSGRSKYVTPGTASPVTVGHVQHVIADVGTLAPRLDIAAAGSLTGTTQALAHHLAQHPQDNGRLQVIPVYEAAA